MGLYIFFLISGHVTSLPPLCGISSALLQYFLLVFFDWTAVEAVWLYFKLVKVFGIQSYIANFSLKAGIPTWSKLIKHVANHNYYDKALFFSCTYADRYPYCWSWFHVLHKLILVRVKLFLSVHMYNHNINPHTCSCRATEWPFWFGTILPFGLVYVFNWIMFIIIMISICKHTRSIENAKGEEGKQKSAIKSLIIAVILAFVFGLGWAIGLAATSLPIKEITYIFQVIFCILVGAQGVLIFFLQGLRSKDFRHFWRQIFYSILCKTHLSSVLTTTKTAAGTLTHGTDMAGVATLSSEKVYSSGKGQAVTLSSIDWKESKVDV